MKKTIFAAVSFLMMVGMAAAENEITGAFGVEFGELLPADVAPKILDQTGYRLSGYNSESQRQTVEIPLYAIEPPVKNKNLDSYRIALSPISKLPYSITGEAQADTVEECKELEAGFIAVISGKYPKAWTRVDDYSFKHFHLNGRRVSIKCARGIKRVWVTFTDSHLTTQVIEEQLNLDKEVVSSDGL